MLGYLRQNKVFVGTLILLVGAGTGGILYLIGLSHQQLPSFNNLVPSSAQSSPATSKGTPISGSDTINLPPVTAPSSKPSNSPDTPYVAPQPITGSVLPSGPTIASPTPINQSTCGPESEQEKNQLLPYARQAGQAQATLTEMSDKLSKNPNDSDTQAAYAKAVQNYNNVINQINAIRAHYGGC